MDFEIRFQGLESSDPLREHAELLVLAHLGRFRSELTQVSVVVGRRNGGSRLPEFRCEITATGPRLPGTTVDHRGLSAASTHPRNHRHEHECACALSGCGAWARRRSAGIAWP